jgi:hypothetical protein
MIVIRLMRLKTENRGRVMWLIRSASVSPFRLWSRLDCLALAAMPLHIDAPRAFPQLESFRQGLRESGYFEGEKEAGFVEGQKLLRTPT